MRTSSGPTETATADPAAGAMDIIAMPDAPPALTPGLIRALAQLIRNSQRIPPAAVAEIPDQLDKRALAS